MPAWNVKSSTDALATCLVAYQKYCCNLELCKRGLLHLEGQTDGISDRNFCPHSSRFELAQAHCLLA